MADVVARSTQPALAAIKLAWWRERLEELDSGLVPAEPHLQAATRELLPRGLSGADLAGLEEGWAALLSDAPDISLVNRHGARLFALAARLLGIPFDDAMLGEAGRLFVRVDFARRGLCDLPDDTIAIAPAPKGARPLTALAALAARDSRRGSRGFESEATPGRSWTLIGHRLTGRI